MVKNPYLMFNKLPGNPAIRNHWIAIIKRDEGPSMQVITVKYLHIHM